MKPSSKTCFSTLAVVGGLLMASCAGEGLNAGWRVSRGGEERDVVYSVEAFENSTYVGGQISVKHPDGEWVWEPFVEKLDQNGESLWIKRFTDSRPGTIVNMVSYKDSIVAVGYFETGTKQVGFATRIAPDGSLIWERIFQNYRYTTAHDVATDGENVAIIISSAEKRVVSSTERGVGGDNFVALAVLDGDGVEANRVELGELISEDSTYLIEKIWDGWVYAGEKRAGESINGELIYLDSGFRKIWQRDIHDDNLVGIENLGKVLEKTGTTLLHVVGHYKTKLLIGGQETRENPSRRNGFLATFTKTGEVVNLNTLNPNGGWATIYSADGLKDGSIVAVGEYDGQVSFDGETDASYYAKGDRDSIIMVVRNGEIDKIMTFDEPERDGIFSVKTSKNCQIVIGGVIGGGERDPGGEDIWIGSIKVRAC